MNNIRNFVIIAHIDHGKSTLADRFLELTNTVEKRTLKTQHLDMMDLERERGITIKLQPVRMIYQTPNNKSQITNNLEIGNWKLEIASSGYILNLIDTPGHVDFGYEVSRSLAAVEGAVLVVDATQGIQAQTLANLHQAQKQNLKIIPVMNKIDLPNADIEKIGKEIAELLNINSDEIIPISAKTGENVEKVLERIVEVVPPPKIETNNITRALIFDSVFDEYRGVVAYVRIIDGELKRGDKIKFLRSGSEDEILEVGYFAPKYTKSDALKTGEIGYIVTNLKEVSQCRVGDTIAKNDDKNIEPLPGYKEPQPMVFAGIYTADGEIAKLRDAIGKLKLNDASLTYEPEASKAFGSGFKCGFLGLLHLEIIKERLEREYNLNLIITTPQVDYREYQAQGKINYEEPWVSLEIVCPYEYIGQVIELAHKHRAIQKDMNYIGDRVILYYDAPLAEIIVNFYDELKSVSAGYASVNYELIGYRKEDLVKMDVIVAQEKIDVLAQIVHRSQINFRANAIVNRLKELIPKQMFDVSIQAAVGGKILARADISAMKKDVTGYLYGGDISRKKKLWAKQAKGKKKMKKLGRVDIPSDVFIKLLKNN